MAKKHKILSLYYLKNTILFDFDIIYEEINKTKTILLLDLENRYK
jgi:hypothetical protein